MLPVGGRPVIDRVLERVAQSGVRQVLMNLHHCPALLTDFCGDGRRWEDARKALVEMQMRRPK